jgi:iron transport multicopper oxidase
MDSSHAQGQYGDGLRGALIVEDPNPPYRWDEEQVLTLSDWYHDQMPLLIPKFLSNKENPSGAEPIPYSALLNDGTTTSFNMIPGRTYYFHIINMATFSQIFLNFEEHNMTIIEVDGVYTQPREVESLWVATAQRYGVLITAKDVSTRNYAFTASLDIDAFDHNTHYLHPNATGQLIYDAGKPKAVAQEVEEWRVIDDFTLTPHDEMPLLDGTPDQIIHLDLNFSTIAGQNRYVCES